MRRKFFGLALSTLLFALGFPAEAQQPTKIPRIGYQAGSLGTAANPDPTTHAFRQRLKISATLRGKIFPLSFA